MTRQIQTVGDWENEFDVLFGEPPMERSGRFNYTQQHIKQFIKDLLSQAQQEAVSAERKKILKKLTVTLNLKEMLPGWEKWWIKVDNRYIENCLECENVNRIKEALKEDK